MKGQSRYTDDPYGAFVEDVRRAIIRATSYGRDGTMSKRENNTILAVANTLYERDPDAIHVNPSRSGR